jgi:hypothetical protein
MGLTETLLFVTELGLRQGKLKVLQFVAVCLFEASGELPGPMGDYPVQIRFSVSVLDLVS